MRRYTVDHLAGKSGRDAALVDEQGRAALRLQGAWAVTDDDGRTRLFLSPDMKGIAKQAIVTGMISGALGFEATQAHYSPNAGEGVQVVKRATTPMRGIPFRWTPFATVSRARSDPGVPPPYAVQLHEPGLPPVGFAQQVDAASLAGYANGFGDPRYGVYDLVHADGRPILRHWAAIDGRSRLVSSVLDVSDETFPLPEATSLCLARFLSWAS